MLSPLQRSSRRFVVALWMTTTSRGLRKKVANPGLSYQIAAIEDAAKEMESNPEGFGDLETDLLNVHKSHKQYELERQQQADKIRRFMVKSKYFRDAKLPNLLTYAEKEQIRLLHNRDPEQWSVQILAESFPANTEIIQKILKANWKPKSIESHDAKVYKNWELFMKGELKVPNDLADHLKKFSHRKMEQSKENSSDTKELTTIETKPIQYVPRSTQFSSIITMGKPKHRSESNQKSNEVFSSSPFPNKSQSGDEETFLLDKIVNKKSMRLTDLQRSQPELTSLISSTDKSNPFDQTQQELVAATDTKMTSSMTGVVGDLPAFSQKFTINEIEISADDMKRFEVSTVKK